MKKLLKIYLSVAILLLSCGTVFASNNNKWQQYYPYLDDIGNIKKGPTIILDGVVNNTIKVTCKFTVFNYNSYQSQSYTQTKTVTYGNVSDYHNFN